MSTIFETELDGLRREVRAGQSSVLAYWPKVNARNVTVTAASAGLFSETGTSLGALSCAIVEAGFNDEDTPESTYSRIDITVGALDLGQNYAVEVTFTAGGLPHVDTFTVDAVAFPILSASLLSLNDLLEVRPDVIDVLRRQGLRLGYTSATAAESMASVYAVRALMELDERINDMVREARGFRPALILHRDRLHRPLRYTALKMIYAAESSNPEEGEDEASGIYRHFRAAADAAWRSVGPLQFRSVTTDDPTISAARRIGDTRVVSYRRAW